MQDIGPNEAIRGSITSRLIALCMIMGAFFALLNNAVPIGLIASELVISLLLLVVTRYCLHSEGEQFNERLLIIVIPFVVMIPFVVERVSRTVYLAGLPLEATSMCALRNLTLLAFLFPRVQRCQCAGVAASLLSVLSIYLQDDSMPTSIVVFSYSVLSVCWLIGWHWMKFELKAPSGCRRQIPRTAKLSVVGLTLACALLALFTLNTTTATTAIAGFMPSSGGNHRSDPYAFGGIGDGDQMVPATDSARSLGPIESELFLESTMPSIYDVFNDLYQQPAERPKKTSRAIPLAPSDVKSNHDRLARNDVASREFTATRRKSRRDMIGKMDDVQSKALFYVKGRVPVHLKHEVYDSWDGATLSFRGNASPRELTLVGLDHLPWVHCGHRPDATDSREIETHVIRVARLNTHRVPSPPKLYAVSLDKLHSAQVFGWTKDGVLSFAGGTIPRMTVLHAQSIPPRREDVEAVRLIRDEAGVESGLDPIVVRSLQTWTAGAKTDWDCVRSVVAGIQRTCRLDPTASIEATDGDVVNDFLLVERRGPDYLFAIATARLLRELGFRTHVVSGFYARPEGFDRASGQTAVYSDDVHFWVEVQASDQSWITIEPSPGYEVQYARLSLMETLAQRAGALLAAIWSRRIACLFGIACFVAVAIYRRNIYVQVLQCWWRLPLPRTDRAVVRSALSVLDAHAHLHGHQRPPNTPVEKWLRTVVQDSGEVSISLMIEFRRLVQWALYADPAHAPTADNPRRICRAVLDRCHNVVRSHQFNKEQ